MQRRGYCQPGLLLLEEFPHAVFTSGFDGWRMTVVAWGGRMTRLRQRHTAGRRHDRRPADPGPPVAGQSARMPICRMVVASIAVPTCSSSPSGAAWSIVMIDSASPPADVRAICMPAMLICASPNAAP